MLTIKAFTFNAFQENTYVIYNEHAAAIIIDPGCYDVSEQHALHDFIQTNKLQVKRMLFTHAHIDHVLGAAFIEKTYGLKMEMHELELSVWRAIPSYASNYGFVYKSADEPERFLSIEDEIQLGTDILKIIFTPGHSPGSISFYCEAQQFIISGDVLFFKSIGRTDLAGGNYDTLIHSIKTNLFSLPADTKVYSGHGITTTIGQERTHNPFLQ
jgi:glyoxylase-like metal-dependent hydrolase (beta-lactamase superfamily II)